jgi:hypothetical protein
MMTSLIKHSDDGNECRNGRAPHIVPGHGVREAGATRGLVIAPMLHCSLSRFTVSRHCRRSKHNLLAIIRALIRRSHMRPHE